MDVQQDVVFPVLQVVGSVTETVVHTGAIVNPGLVGQLQFGTCPDVVVLIQDAIDGFLHPPVGVPSSDGEGDRTLQLATNAANHEETESSADVRNLIIQDLVQRIQHGLYGFPLQLTQHGLTNFIGAQMFTPSPLCRC